MTKEAAITEIMATANWIAQTAERCEFQSQVTDADLAEVAKLLSEAEVVLGKALSSE
jgi:hypothetical protein